MTRDRTRTSTTGRQPAPPASQSANRRDVGSGPGVGRRVDRARRILRVQCDRVQPARRVRLRSDERIIVNDDPTAYVYIYVPYIDNNASQNFAETDGVTTANFTMNRSDPDEIRRNAASIAVTYTTIDGTVVAPDDYTASTERVVLGPGELSLDIAVQINGDVLAEGNEYFSVALIDLEGVSPCPSEGSQSVAGYILDDDDLPVLNVSSESIVEGNDGAETSMVFEVSLTTPSVSPISATLTTSPIEGYFNDVFGGPFNVTFDPGETTKTITVGVSGASGEVTGTPTTAGAYDFTVTASNSVDPAASHRVALTVQTASADLSVRISGPARASRGDRVKFTVAVTNIGPSTASGVQVVFAWDSRFGFVSDSPVGSRASRQTAGLSRRCSLAGR